MNRSIIINTQHHLDCDQLTRTWLSTNISTISHHVVSLNSTPNCYAPLPRRFDSCHALFLFGDHHAHAPHISGLSASRRYTFSLSHRSPRKPQFFMWSCTAILSPHRAIIVDLISAKSVFFCRFHHLGVTTYPTTSEIFAIPFRRAAI